MSAATPPKDMSHLRARRREARRRRNIARLDVGAGLLIAAVLLLLIAPGLAIVAIVALLVLAACAVSAGLERRRSPGRSPRVRSAEIVRRSRRQFARIVKKSRL
jgi:Flp pilus assembly protein TadB